MPVCTALSCDADLDWRSGKQKPVLYHAASHDTFLGFSISTGFVSYAEAAHEAPSLEVFKARLDGALANLN